MMFKLSCSLKYKSSSILGKFLSQQQGFWEWDSQQVLRTPANSWTHPHRPYVLIRKLQALKPTRFGCKTNSAILECLPSRYQLNRFAPEIALWMKWFLNRNSQCLDVRNSRKFWIQVRKTLQSAKSVHSPCIFGLACLAWKKALLLPCFKC